MRKFRPYFYPSFIGELYMKRVKKTNYKKQKKYFAKTSALNGVAAINSRPAPQRGGFRK